MESSHVYAMLTWIQNYNNKVSATNF